MSLATARRQSGCSDGSDGRFQKPCAGRVDVLMVLVWMLRPQAGQGGCQFGSGMDALGTVCRRGECHYS